MSAPRPARSVRTALRALAGPLAAGVLLAAAPAAAQTARPDSARAAARTLAVAPAAGAIRVDGRLDEPAWELATAATGFVQRRPRPGSPATAPSEVRVLYGDDALYVGARLYDQPDSIAAQLARRDASGIYSDWVSVLLDSDNDKRTAFAFSVTPRGVRRDGITFENGRLDVSWDAVWEAETLIDSAGWTAEFRIPLSQLRFSPGQAVWGINFSREVARREELAFWSALLPNQPGYVSAFGQLEGMAGLKSAARLELEPYALSRLTRKPGVSADPFYSSNDLFASAGLDLRYRLTSNFTLTGTVNPDFGQVEADPAVVNLTAFETFQPERRPFFVQGAEIFDFRLGSEFDTEMLFYSRRIGHAPLAAVPFTATYRSVPELTRIVGAAKVSGKSSRGWSLGLLEVVTAPEFARYTVGADGAPQRMRVEPLTNYAVGRVSKDFRSGQSAVGMIGTATHRDLEGKSLDFLRSAAYAGGVDGRHRFAGGRYEATGWLVGSRVEGSRAAIQATQLQAGHYFQRPDADHLEYDSTRTSLQGFAAEAQVSKIGGNWTWKLRGNVRSPEFEINDLGFLRNSDRITQAGELKYSRYQPGRVFRNWNVALNQGLGWTFGGEGVERFANVNSAFQLNNFWGGFVLLGRTFPVLTVSDLRGGPALRTIASTGATATLYTDRRRRVGGSAFGQVNVRDQAGGWNAFLAPAVSIRPSPRWELSMGPSLSWNVDPAQYVDRRTVAGEALYFVGRLEQTTASLTARLNYTFAPNLSFQFYAQPFISAGDYTTFRQVRSPRAERFGERFRTFGDDEVAFNEQTRRYRLDLNGDGTFDTDIRNPAFNVKQLRSNAVLRWEYRPGSTLFVVWNQGRQDFRPDGSFVLDRDAERLFEAEGTNVLLIKLSYWLNM